MVAKMSNERLIQDAKTILFQLKKEERRSINPYASFADQMIALINNGRISSKPDVIRFTKTYYSRPRMNRQWRTFGNVLDKSLRQLNKESLLYLFGYLKCILTIEGKKEFAERNKHKKGKWGQTGRGNHKGKPHKGRKNFKR
jgi:hypothetical protein